MDYLEYLNNLHKSQQKLVFEEHFGFPYYSLIHKMQEAHGDKSPEVSTTKTIHSQIQLLYGELFARELMASLKEKSVKEHRAFQK